MVTTLKYKRFDQLLSEVMVDFKNFSLENMVEPQELIKVARRVTYDLGLRIYQTKETVLDVCHGQVRLPDDFFVFNFGLICGEFTETVALPQGTHTHERLITPGTTTPYWETPANVDLCSDGQVCSVCNLPASPACGCAQTVSCSTPITVPDYNPLVPYGDTCVKPRVFMNCKGEAYELYQTINTQTRTYKQFFPVRLVGTSTSYVDCGCPNTNMTSPHEIQIKDGFVKTNFSDGKLYINYQGSLEDADGNLLVADHEYLNEYYEYALKHRLLENLWFNGEDVERKRDYAERQKDKAQRIAKAFVLTPNFAEIKEMWLINRRAQMSKYYDMFQPTIGRGGLIF